MQKCNCKFQICDMGILHCQLEKDHIDSHKYTFDESSFYHRNVDIFWSRNEFKDINIDLIWLKNNSNLIDTLDLILNKYDCLDYYSLNDTSFNDDLYGEDFTLNIDFHLNNDIKLNLNNDFDEFLKFQKNHFGLEDLEVLFIKEFYDIFNLDINLYNLHIGINLSFETNNLI